MYPSLAQCGSLSTHSSGFLVETVINGVTSAGVGGTVAGCGGTVIGCGGFGGKGFFVLVVVVGGVVGRMTEPKSRDDFDGK